MLKIEMAYTLPGQGRQNKQNKLIIGKDTIIASTINLRAIQFKIIFK